MSDTVSPEFGPLDEDIAEIIFSQPAFFADRIAITERGGVFRIGLAEEVPGKSPQFRGAFVISTEGAKQMQAMLKEMIGTVERRSNEK